MKTPEKKFLSIDPKVVNFSVDSCDIEIPCYRLGPRDEALRQQSSSFFPAHTFINVL